MAQATAELDESATHEQSADDIHTDMLASFADDESESASTTSPTETTDASAKPDLTDTSTETETTETPETQEAEPVTIESALQMLKDLESKSKHSADTLGGRLGSLEQALKALQATTGRTKTKVRGSIERFGEFGKEYPDFAKAQVEFVNGLLDELDLPGLPPEFTTNLIKEAGAAAETAAEQRFNRMRSDSCRDDLSETHPGWEQIIGLPEKDVADGGVPPDTEFRRWLATQPNGYGERVLNSYSPIVIGKALDKFHDSKKTAAKPNPNPGPSPRQQRLSAAVTAKSSGTVPKPKKELSPREAMLAAFEGDD